MVEVEVEFDYDAELPDELTIRTGDLIHDVKQMDGGWWEGVLGGKRGVFPDNFVRVVSKDGQQKKTRKPLGSSSGKEENESSAAADGAVVTLRKHGMSGSFRGGDARVGSAGSGIAAAAGSASSASKKQCRVLFSYNPTHDDELELKLDEVVEVMGEVEDGWWRGTIDGKVGVFPSNFVEVINQRPPLATADKSSVENKNLKNENQRDKVPTSSKISSLIQEVEAKAKSLTTPADLVAAGSRKRNNSSTENLNPSGSVSGSASVPSSAVAVNPVVAVSAAANHVSSVTQVAAQQRRQSPLGREAAKKSDHKRATSMSNAESTTTAAEQSALANAPKLPPKPGDEAPDLFSCPPLPATRRPPIPRPRQQTNMLSFSQCPSTKPIRKVDSFLLSNERAQLLLGSGCSGSTPNVQSQVMTERVSKTRKFLRRISMFMSIGHHKSSPVVEEEEGCLSESSFCSTRRKSPSRKRNSITGSSVSTPQFSTYGATGDGALVRTSTPRRSWSAFFHRLSPKAKHDDGSQFSLSSSGVQSCYEPLVYASSLPELAEYNPPSRRRLCRSSLSDRDVTKSSGFRRINQPFPNYPDLRTVNRSCQTESPIKQQQFGVASIWSSRFKLSSRDDKTKSTSPPPPSPAALSRFGSSISTKSFEHFPFFGKTNKQEQGSSTPELWRRGSSQQCDGEDDVYEEPSSVYDLPFDSAAEVAVDTQDLLLVQPPKMRRNRIITNVKAFINQKRRTQETDF